MSYQVLVDFTPAYELLSSLEVFLSGHGYKFLELPKDWTKQVRQQLSPSLVKQLESKDEICNWCHLSLLVWQCPDRSGPEGFIRWLAGLSAGELYDRLAPRANELYPLPRDLSAQRETDVAVLTAWHEQYFRTVDPALFAGLAAVADRWRAQAQAAAADLVELVDQATGGIWVAPEPGLETVLLVPQHHFRPWTVPAHLRGLRIFGCAADVVPVAPGEPSPALLRLTRALSDENRLRMLQLLATGPKALTEVVAHVGLTKGTVYHHMIALRTAGLVRVHDGHGYNKSYSLRPGALAGVGARLESFVFGL